MWKQSDISPSYVHLSSNLNAAERVLTAANSGEKHPLFTCRRGTACVFSLLPYKKKKKRHFSIFCKEQEVPPGPAHQ